jgi:Flp pilus assembly protein TadG
MKRFIDKIGFAATESALVLVILGMLAGTSYYVWRSNQQAKASLDAASQSAASTVQTHKLASPKQIKSSPPQPQNAQYLTIKEWGVRFILPQAITNATYVMQAGESYYCVLASSTVIACYNS